MSEKFIVKAQTLLYSYAHIVYTEEELMAMSQDVTHFESLDENNMLLNGGSIGESISQGIGNLFSMFKGANVGPPDKRASMAHKKGASGISSLDRSHAVLGGGMNSSFQVEEHMNMSIAECSRMNGNNMGNGGGGGECGNAGFFTKFNSPEDVYKYLVNIGSILVVEREKITQLFKKIQQSFSELFYHSRLLYNEVLELELLKDFFKVRVQFLKQKVQQQEKDKEELEKCFTRERDLKDSFINKNTLLEKRLFEAQAELIMHRQKSQRFDGEKKELETKIKSLDENYGLHREQMEERIEHLNESINICEKQKREMKKAMSDYESYMMIIIS